MKKHIPDMLTLSRVVLFIPLLVVFTLQQQYVWAAVIYGVGLATNCLDGFLARHWNAFSKYGGTVLQPTCDMAYATAAVWLLIAIGSWPFWIGVMLVLIAGVLQLISFLAEKQPKDRLIRVLKRHQSYLHPLYSVIVMTLAWWSFVFLAANYTSDATRTMWAMLYAGGIVGAALLSGQYVHRLVRASLAKA